MAWSDKDKCNALSFYPIRDCHASQDNLCSSQCIHPETSNEEDKDIAWFQPEYSQCSSKESFFYALWMRAFMFTFDEMSPKETVLYSCERDEARARERERERERDEVEGL